MCQYLLLHIKFNNYCVIYKKVPSEGSEGKVGCGFGAKTASGHEVYSHWISCRFSIATSAGKIGRSASVYQKNPAIRWIAMPDRTLKP